MAFRILHPARGRRGNDGSCVLRVTTAAGSLLLPGDLEAAGEAALLARGEEVAARAVVAPHHGSATSSSGPFVRAVAARYVLYPVGYRNRYGFPDPQVRRRYHEAGTAGVTTADSGAITLRLGRHDLRLSRYRARALRYWMQPPAPLSRGSRAGPASR